MELWRHCGGNRRRDLRRLGIPLQGAAGSIRGRHPLQAGRDAGSGAAFATGDLGQIGWHTHRSRRQPPRPVARGARGPARVGARGCRRSGGPVRRGDPDRRAAMVPASPADGLQWATKTRPRQCGRDHGAMPGCRSPSLCRDLGSHCLALLDADGVQRLRYSRVSWGGPVRTRRHVTRSRFHVRLVR